MPTRAANFYVTQWRGFGLLLASAVGLAACSSVTPVSTEIASAGMPNPEIALRQSMRNVERDVSGLGGFTASAVTAARAAPVLPEPLQRTVTFEWNGPLEEGVARLAQSVGYTFFLTAPQGNAPLPVSISVRDVSAHEAFRALGEAAGTRATVRLVPSRAQVQVIYNG